MGISMETVESTDYEVTGTKFPAELSRLVYKNYVVIAEYEKKGIQPKKLRTRLSGL